MNTRKQAPSHPVKTLSATDTNQPRRVPIFASLDRERLRLWRKQVISARENWLDIQKQYGRDDRELALLAKGEAADCLKHERACTQIIEWIDGTRPALGEIQGDRAGWLSHRVPAELTDVFKFCVGMASA